MIRIKLLKDLLHSTEYFLSYTYNHFPIKLYFLVFEMQFYITLFHVILEVVNINLVHKYIKIDIIT